MRVPLLLCLLSAPYTLAQQPDPGLLQRYSEEGQRALAEQRYDDAATAYEKLRQLSPGTAEVHAGLGSIYFQQRRFAEAARALQQALKLQPALPKADILLAMSLSELGRQKEALPGLQKGYGQSADPVVKRSCGLYLLRAYTALQRDSDAVKVALDLTKLHPDDPEVLYHAGRLFANYAYLTTMKLSRVAPTSVWLHQAAGEADESQGLLEAAIGEYRAVLALEPRRPGIHYRVGRTFLARAKQSETEAPAFTAEALKEFEQELALDSTNANAAYEAGEIYRKAGDAGKARVNFELAVAHSADFEEAQVGLGRVLIAEGKAESALPHLRKATELDPQDEVAYYQLALAERAVGNVAEQEKALAQMRRLYDLRRTREKEMLPPVATDVTRQELDSASLPETQR